MVLAAGVKPTTFRLRSDCTTGCATPADGGARGIEPTMDGLKDRYSAIELYPRVGTRPGIRTPNIFDLSEAPLPVGPAARVGDPAGSRTWICAFGKRRLVHWATGSEPSPVIETGSPTLEESAASQREGRGMGPAAGVEPALFLIRSQVPYPVGRRRRCWSRVPELNRASPA